MFNLAAEKIKQFTKRPFVKDLIGLEINAFFYALVVGVASILLARFLGRDQYGLYVLAFALAGLLGQVFQLGNSQTLVTLLSEGYGKKSKSEIASVVGWYLKVNLSTVLPLTAVILFAAGPIAQYAYHKPELASLARMVIFASLVSGFLQLITTIFQAARHIRALVWIEMSDVFFKKVLMVSAAIAGLGIFWVVFAQLGGAILGLCIALLFYWMYRTYDTYLPALWEIRNAVRHASITRYLSFDLTIVFERVINSGFKLLPPLLLGIVASSGDVAVFSIAYGYMFLPGIFITPIARMLSVILPQSYQISTDPWKKFLYSGLVSGAVMLFGSLALFVAAPILIPLLYGERYQLSVDMARQLFFAAAFMGAGAGFGGMIRALRKNVFFTVLNAVVMVLGLGLFWLYYSLHVQALTTVIFMVTFWNVIPIFLVYFIMYYWLKDKKINHQSV